MVETISLPVVLALLQGEGRDVKLFEFSQHPRRTAQAIAAYAPDIVGYSMCTNQQPEFMAFNRLLKGVYPCFSLFGGPHATFSPEFVLEDGVDALCRGEADISFFNVKEMHLTDYKVRVINSKAATAAKVRVLIESQDEKDSWTTVGVHENVIEASWEALIDSIEYKLLKDLKT